MTTEEIVILFVQEFIPEGYSISSKHCSTLRDFKNTVQKVFAKHIGIELPKDNIFYCDVLELLEYIIKYPGDRDSARKYLKEHQEWANQSIEVKCSPRRLKEVRNVYTTYHNLGGDKQLEKNALQEKLEAFKKLYLPKYRSK